MRYFSLKSLHADLVLVEKVRMVASCWLFTAFWARFLVRMCVDFGDAYVAVRTSMCTVFRYVVFQPSLCVFFVLLPVKSEVSVHGEVLS